MESPRINPRPEQWWPNHPSIDILHKLMEGLDRVTQGLSG